MKSFSRLIIPRLSLMLISAAIILAVCCSTFAQQGGKTIYLYDDNGRLRAVISPTGEALVYEYDAAGNFTALRKLAANALEIFSFSPRSGLAGTVVTFYGVGFGTGVNSVSFNGTNGNLIQFTNTSVVAIVPAGATTGPVTINTALGPVTTATPFRIEGISLNPSIATLQEGDELQFAVEMQIPGPNQNVKWSVNGIEGGNNIIGRITVNGLYMAPTPLSASFNIIVRATSVSTPSLYGEAQIRVFSLNDLRLAIAQGVSIVKGEGAAPLALSPSVSVGRGPEASPLLMSPSVAVARGPEVSPLALSSVSVGKGADAALESAISPGVALAKGPVISAITPGNVAQGANAAVTISGTNFNGATSLIIITPGSGVDAMITASNIVVNPAGTTLTATLSVGAGSAVGRRVIIVVTPVARSSASDLGINTIQIVP